MTIAYKSTSRTRSITQGAAALLVGSLKQQYTGGGSRRTQQEASGDRSVDHLRKKSGVKNGSPPKDWVQPASAADTKIKGTGLSFLPSAAAVEC